MSCWPDKRVQKRTQREVVQQSDDCVQPPRLRGSAQARQRHPSRQNAFNLETGRAQLQFWRRLPAILFFILLALLSQIAERFGTPHSFHRHSTPPLVSLEIPKPLALPPSQPLPRLLMSIPEFVPPPQHDEEVKLASLEEVGPPRDANALPMQLASSEAQSHAATAQSHFVVEDLRVPSSAVRSQTGVRIERLAFVQAAVLSIGTYGFLRSEKLFGGIVQPFKIGNDLMKDRTFGFDELMHFQGGYRIAQGVAGLYRWAGVSPTAADWMGAAVSAGVMTTMEYIDGRRPNDEASYSDFTANLLGVSFALLKPRLRYLQDIDLRFSYLSPMDFFRRKKVKRYERMTNWLTYDLKRKWNIPIYLAAGYSVRQARRPKAHPEFYFGIGLSPIELADRVFPEAAKPLEFLRFYHFGSRTQLF